MDTATLILLGEIRDLLIVIADKLVDDATPVVRGRGPKLTEMDVMVIKHLLGKSVAYPEIERWFGISKQHLSNIKAGRAWSDVSSLEEQ